MTAPEIVERIRALRELTRRTGNQTFKSQDAILRSLDPTLLAEVALLLNKQDDVLSDKVTR